MAHNGNVHPVRQSDPRCSRSEHELGSTLSATIMRSKLMRMSRRFLFVRQLVRFQPDAPNSGTVAEWRGARLLIEMARVRFSPVPPTKTVCRRRLAARMADLQSADGSSILLAGTN